MTMCNFSAFNCGHWMFPCPSLPSMGSCFLQSLSRLNPCPLSFLEITVSISSFIVFSSAESPILGFLWFKHHNPHINWAACRVESWGSHCFLHCLRSALAFPPATTTEPTAEVIDLSVVPEEYHNLKLNRVNFNFLKL